MSPGSYNKLKKTIRRQLGTARRIYMRRFFPFTPSEFAAALQTVGVSKGDTLMVHSAFSKFDGFSGTVLDAIHVLMEAVGTDGTLLMPTLPFPGRYATAVEYVRDHPVFDVKHTPSRTGIISEVFRRHPDVKRSLHPTHAVAGWGARADELMANHYQAETPCGRNSPYHRLLQAEGKVVLLGVEIGNLTVFHAFEEELEPQMPFSPFTREWFTLSVKGNAGDTHTCRTRLFEPSHSRRRDLTPLAELLKKRGQLHESRIRQLDIVLLNVVEAWQACQDLSSAGVYCYK
jgi:aminoglycoside 3-N-acetyltransferase